MGPSPLLLIASSTAVMVRVRGPDPKRRKMRRHAFYNYDSGTTALSASGMLLEEGNGSQNQNQRSEEASASCGDIGLTAKNALVITDGTVVQSFLRQTKLAGQQQGVGLESAAQLIPGAEIHVLAEDICKRGRETKIEGSTGGAWHPGTLVAVVDVPAASVAVQALLAAHSSTGGGLGWELGWALSHSENQKQQQQEQQGVVDRDLPKPPTGLSPCQAAFPGQQPGQGRGWLATHAASNSAGLVTQDTGAMPLVQLALIRVHMSERSSTGGRLLRAIEQQRQLRKEFQVPEGLASCEKMMRGDILAAVGSPFGILSPHHFLNSVTKGVVANQWPPNGALPAILMADMRCLPGMEGAPVVDERGAIVGILNRPLRQQSTGAEVHLVITANAMEESLRPFSTLLHSSSISLTSTNASRSSNSLPSCQANGIPSHPSRRSGATLVGFKPSSASASNPDKSSPEALESASCRATAGSSESPFAHHQGAAGEISISPSPPWEGVSAAVQAAAASVVLITVGEGSWASGVVLNRDGLILTNAHLVEPWRFNKALAQPPDQPSQGIRRRTTSEQQSLSLMDSQAGPEPSLSPLSRDNSRVSDFVPLQVEEAKQWPKRRAQIEKCTVSVDQDQSHATSRASTSEMASFGEGCHSTTGPNIAPNSPHPPPLLSSTSFNMSKVSPYPHKSRHRIRVRVDQSEGADGSRAAGARWQDAEVVFVSQGPLDVALLKLRGPLHGLRPIVAEMEAPELGCTAVVIGHGLFGPRSGLQPSVSAGVVSGVVMAPALEGLRAIGRMSASGSCLVAAEPQLRPALIQTTAAVHAGGSGGVVVNHRGHMVSLVTSNAKHNGWAVLPHLNFSIPCAALAAIFHFALSNAPDSSLLSGLNSQDKELSTIWALVPAPAPPPPLLLPPTNDSLGDRVNMPSRRGSRFATFFADAVPKFLEKGQAQSSLKQGSSHSRRILTRERASHMAESDMNKSMTFSQTKSHIQCRL